MEIINLDYNAIHLHDSKLLVSDVGVNNDDYTVTASMTLNVEDDSIVTKKYCVRKNYFYNFEPKDKSKIVEGRKYRVDVEFPTLKECYNYVQNIVDKAEKANSIISKF